MTDSEIYNKLCVSFRNKNIDKWLLQFPKIQWAEARLDLMQPSLEEIQQIFTTPIRWIATCHPCQQSDETRKQWLQQAITAGATMVDISINETTDFFQSLQLFAKKNDCRVMASYHNFNQTLNYQELRTIIQYCYSFHPDFVKVAYFIQSEKDVEIIHRLYQEFDSIIIIGMGELYSDIRLKIIEWGAPFTFIAPNSDSKTASGQYTLEETMLFFKKKI